MAKSERLPTITRSAIQSMTTPQSFQRGEDYYAIGAVLELVRRGDTVYAEVEGSSYEPYQVEVTFDKTGVGGAFCTCPYDWGGWCKHIVAVLLAVADASDDVEVRPTVATLLEKLDAAQLRALVEALVEQHPGLIDVIEGQVATVQAMPLPSKLPAKPRPSVPAVDPTPFKRQVHSILHSLDRMRASEAYWHVSSVADQVRGIIDKAWKLIRAGDGNNALRVLQGITEAYAGEWYNLDDSDGYAYEVFNDLGEAWAEAALAADLTPDERQQWIDDLDDLGREVSDYGDGDVFETAQEALREGWDDPALLQILRDGPDAQRVVWVMDEDRPFYATTSLTTARLNVLERQGRHQEYLNLAHARGQTTNYVTMLVKLGQIEDAVAFGLEQVTSISATKALAETLHEYGHTEAALRVAEHGLELSGQHKASLAFWLRDVAAGLNQPELALRAAVTGFKASASLEAYQQVRELAGDGWTTLREELLALLRQPATYTQQAAVEIFVYEKLIDDAIRALGEHAYYRLVELVVDAAIEVRPDWCIQACKAQAEPIMDEGKSKSYHHAANWLAKAKAAYRAAGRESEWRAYLASLLDVHRRKRSLVPLLKGL